MTGDLPLKTSLGNGGEPHQRIAADATHDGGGRLTTNQGLHIADGQTSLSAGPRGPTVLEDFVLHEEIFHFDHERFPERIVHAR